MKVESSCKCHDETFGSIKCEEALEQLHNVRFEVFKVVTMKNGVFWDVTPVALVRTNVSEELSASIIRVKKIDELGTMLAITSKAAHTAKKYKVFAECIGC
jgi:hypothetical protein